MPDGRPETLWRARKGSAHGCLSNRSREGLTRDKSTSTASSNASSLSVDRRDVDVKLGDGIACNDVGEHY